MLNTRTSKRTVLIEFTVTKYFLSDLEYYFDYYALMNSMVIWKSIT